MKPTDVYQTCSLKQRAQSADDVCLHLPNAAENMYKDKPQTFVGLYINNERKTVYCRVNKAGSRQARSYFKLLDTEGKGMENTLYSESFQHPERGFYQLLDMPVDEALKRFSSYTKVVMVRHPLQRFVSAYYELVLDGHNIGRGIQNLTDFLYNVVLKKPDSHYLDYQQSCHPCLMKYDYVGKTETLTSDNSDLSEILAGKANILYSKGHVNERLSSQTQHSEDFKYDEILRNFEKDDPEAFKKLLDWYSADMRLFGYTWANGYSGCEDGNLGCC